MNREDFPMLNNDLVYLDNSATSLKPKCVIDKMVDYYENYSANAHRGDYDISYRVDTEYEKVREDVSLFLNCDKECIVFTSGTTDSLNMIALGYFKKRLNSSDEILITKAEHASNVLPWFNIHKENGTKIKYIELDNNLVTLENVKKAITNNTKVISLAIVTNVLGDVRPLKEIIKYAHEHNILVVVDAAQGAPHMRIDVTDLDADFLALSAHKMYGPTGLGILYGKYGLLVDTDPVNLGGGMNESFDTPDDVILKDVPTKFEAGTPNIASVIAFGESIKYLNNIGMDVIHEREVYLKKLLVKKLKDIKHIHIYNSDTESGLVTFTVDDIFSQDVAYYLNKYHVCVRAGNHCAKLLKDVIGVTNTVRVSLAFYNNEDEINMLVDLLKDKDRIVKEMI